MMNRARGIAVITVLLALALGVLISSEIITRVYNGMKRSANQFNALQASEYALGGEAWARQRLRVEWDKEKEKGIFKDHMHQEWALPAQTLDVEGGFIEIEIYDLQARFNLNNLIDTNGAVVPKQVHIFARLLGTLAIPTNYADMAARWASYTGVDNAYGTTSLPYREGNTYFGSISELRLLRDMDLAAYNRLAPYISAIPILPDVAVSAVAININTAPEPILLSMPTKTPAAERMQQFLNERESDKEGFSDTGKYMSAMGGQVDAVLSTKSSYFEIRVRAQYGERRSYLISVVYRDPATGEIRLLSRDKGQQFSVRGSAQDAKKAGKNSAKS